MKDLTELGTQKKLNSLEKPKSLFLTLDPFTVENDLLTTTSKLKRNIAKKYFEQQIKAMYASGPINVGGPGNKKND